MDTVSTLSNIAHGGSGYIWYILGGLGGLALTIRYSKSQRVTSRDNSPITMVDGDAKGDININTLPKNKSPK
jgi:hypothetical protein